jgi:predicted porin
MALYQYSSLRGGMYDGDSEQLFVAGVSVNYAISTSLSAELGYNYDNLSSDLNTALDLRSFDRNRVYVGLRAAF